MTFEYYYRKGAFLAQAIFSVVFLVFIAFWSYTMSAFFSFQSEVTSVSGQQLPVFGPLRLLFTIVPTLMGAFGLFLLGQSLRRVFATKPVLSGDEHGLQVSGKGFKSYQITWDDIDYLRYEQRLRQAAYHTNHRGQIKQTGWLIVKPKEGRAVEVEITHLEGTIDDILSDIKKLAPSLLIKGVD